MSRKIKVLQLQYRYHAGVSDLAEQAIHGLPHEQFDITTAFLCGTRQPDEPESHAQRTVYFGFRKSSLAGLRMRVLWRLYRFFRDERFDVIIAHRFKPISIVMILSRILAIPVCIGVQHRIGDFDRRYRRLQARWLLRSNWRMVGVSRAVRDYLLGCGAGFTPDNTVMINNALDIEQAEKLQHPQSRARELLGLPADAFIFGTIGRLVPVKRHIHLIEAFAQLHERHPNAMVAIIGEGRSRADLEACIRHHGLEGRVMLLGSRDGALQYVRAYDVFVMPSFSEGLPMALLEGMSAHLPIIASDIDSMRSIVEDAGGHLFKVEDVDDLANHLEHMLQASPDALAEEGKRAYAYLQRAHRIEDFRNQYRDLILDSMPEQGV